MWDKYELSIRMWQKSNSDVGNKGENKLWHGFILKYMFVGMWEKSNQVVRISFRVAKLKTKE